MVSQYSDNEDKTIYKVVVNDEEQYSIWPDYSENPRGWNDVGKVGPKVECLTYIKEAWTDMRPRSLRKKMEEMAQKPSAPASSGRSEPRRGKSLVDRLCAGDHPITLTLNAKPTVKLFKQAVDNGYLHFKFTDTQPGTELGVRFERDACDFGEANFEDGTGTARVVGELSLNYAKVRCVVDINLETLAGYGHLEKIEPEATLD